jgi:hypothetical protein
MVLGARDVKPLAAFLIVGIALLLLISAFGLIGSPELVIVVILALAAAIAAAVWDRRRRTA